MHCLAVGGTSGGDRGRSAARLPAGVARRFRLGRRAAHYRQSVVTNVFGFDRDLVRRANRRLFSNDQHGVLDRAAFIWRKRDRLSRDRKSTRLNSSHPSISYAVFCLKKKKQQNRRNSNGGRNSIEQ